MAKKKTKDRSSGNSQATESPELTSKQETTVDKSIRPRMESPGVKKRPVLLAVSAVILLGWLVFLSMIAFGGL